MSEPTIDELLKPEDEIIRLVKRLSLMEKQLEVQTWRAERYRELCLNRLDNILELRKEIEVLELNNRLWEFLDKYEE